MQCVVRFMSSAMEQNRDNRTYRIVAEHASSWLSNGTQLGFVHIPDDLQSHDINSNLVCKHKFLYSLTFLFSLYVHL
jgi:hypothetical protein